MGQWDVGTMGQWDKKERGPSPRPPYRAGVDSEITLCEANIPPSLERRGSR